MTVWINIRIPSSRRNVLLQKQLWILYPTTYEAMKQNYHKYMVDPKVNNKLYDLIVKVVAKIIVYRN